MSKAAHPPFVGSFNVRLPDNKEKSYPLPDHELHRVGERVSTIVPVGKDGFKVLFFVRVEGGWEIA